ncbi:hypothetical protein LX36DRAFT_463634 [Colletotrichum falcatum]|nr:hypothetical protein LX36DRAFT_463634 [Colletotrichum falcatum]
MTRETLPGKAAVFFFEPIDIWLIARFFCTRAGRRRRRRRLSVVIPGRLAAGCGSASVAVGQGPLRVPTTLVHGLHWDMAFFFVFLGQSLLFAVDEETTEPISGRHMPGCDGRGERETE